MYVIKFALLLALSPWVFIPAGFCVCQLSEHVVADHGMTDDSISHEEHPPTEHPPGCPSRKPFDGQGQLCSSCEVFEVQATTPDAILPLLTLCLDDDHPTSKLASDFAPRASRPIFVILRALLI